MMVFTVRVRGRPTLTTSGVGAQAPVFAFYHVVTLTGHRLQAEALDDGDVAATIAEDAGAL